MKTTRTKHPAQFRITGHYRHATLISTATFPTREAAQAENSKWTSRARADGLIWVGRVVPVKAL